MPKTKYEKILCCQTFNEKTKIKASCSHLDFSRILVATYLFLDIL